MKFYFIEYTFSKLFVDDDKMHYFIMQANSIEEAEELFFLSDLPHDGCIVTTEFNNLEEIKAVIEKHYKIDSSD